ncbi:unnamed protein product [Cuscuta epithymum]|uniref:Uncharacterized protein n=1 Tax=Cuscuta epithymum TaxID=186058 RepID=A0AAV0DNU1_9ASTE|nr:unnamed protein product [Cuscuta epithymum]
MNTFATKLMMTFVVLNVNQFFFLSRIQESREPSPCTPVKFAGTDECYYVKDSSTKSDLKSLDLDKSELLRTKLNISVKDGSTKSDLKSLDLDKSELLRTKLNISVKDGSTKSDLKSLDLDKSELFHLPSHRFLNAMFLKSLLIT